MGCALSADLAPEAAAVFPLIAGDRCSSLLLVGTIGLPDAGIILDMQGSRGLWLCVVAGRFFFSFYGCIVQLLSAEMISSLDVFVEPHGRAVLLFAGQTLSTSSPSPPTSTLLSGLSCRRSCRDVGSQHAWRQSRRRHPTFGCVL